MKVIFTSSVKGVAHRGDMKNIKEGFFRNFLLPRNLAVRATSAELAKWEQVREKLRIGKEQLIEKSKEIQKRLEGAVLKISKKVTKTGKLYGGVHAKDVVSALLSQINVEIPEQSVLLKDPIKEGGAHTVELLLPGEVKASVKIEISAE